jgi:heptosyltransferase-1
MNCQALVIRPSSLGDIVHALPIVHDLKRHRPGIEIDWVAEEQFTSLVALNRGVRRVIPLALRRWRRTMLVRSTWRELGVFRRELKLARYDVVIDLQEQLKGALIASLARGPAHGPDRASIREPIATVMYRHTHRVDPRQHLIDRCRQLAGKALGYRPSGEPRFDLAPPLEVAPQALPFAVCLHATSRTDKLWPEAHWRALIGELARAGMRVLLVSGNDEEAKRSVRLAEGNSAATVLPRRELPAIAALLAGADLVCGVDTGLTHLAAALGTPTIAIFIATDPRLAGVERASKRGRDAGGIGIVPAPDEIFAIANELSRGVRNGSDRAR